jgi:excisionase family DNA binding protein
VAALSSDVRALRAEVQALEARLPPSLLGVREAASRLGISVCTLRRWIKSRRVRAVRVGRTVRVDLSAVLVAADADSIAALARRARGLRVERSR